MSIPATANGHTSNNESVLNFLAKCPACPQSIDYKQLTEELKRSAVDPRVASCVLEKFIEWKIFSDSALFTLETVSLITDDRAVSVPVLSLLLRSDELRHYVHEHPADILCYGTSLTTLLSLRETLITTTKPVTLPTIR